MTEALFIWGAIQSLLVSILIPLIKNSRSNYLLSSIFFTTALNILFQYVLRFTNVKFDFPQLLVTPDFLDLLLPTLIYIYLVKIFGDFDAKKHYLLLILPVFWAVVLLIFVLLQKDFRFHSYIDTKLHLLSQILVFLWKIVLLIKIFKYFHQTHGLFKNRYRKLLGWPRTLIVFMGLITLVSLFNLTFFLFRMLEVDMDDSTLTFLRRISRFNYIIFTCFILLISSYFFIRHPKVLAGISSFRLKKHDQDSLKFNDLFEKLKIMEEEKSILDTELNESKLAERLGIKSYLLSKFLNERLGKSFNEFINEKRIEEAKRLLEIKENKNLIMFEIAVDSGFKSESSFYSNFKKHTGMTPKEYQKSFLKN